MVLATLTAAPSLRFLRVAPEPDRRRPQIGNRCRLPPRAQCRLRAAPTRGRDTSGRLGEGGWGNSLTWRGRRDAEATEQQRQQPRWRRPHGPGGPGPWGGRRSDWHRGGHGERCARLFPAGRTVARPRPRPVPPPPCPRDFPGCSQEPRGPGSPAPRLADLHSQFEVLSVYFKSCSL